ncbi:MAG TPA: RDD family protein [Micromonosporaceae bacterium]|nr:RDD family protein [Micromonosporaceae bacterium]
MTSLAVRRIAAWSIDWLIIIGYAAALVPVGLLLHYNSVSLPTGAWNLLSFLLLIAPVTGWLAMWEAGPHSASPGKRLMRLRVWAGPGSPAPFSRTLLRNALKVALPWELGHIAAFTLASPTAIGPGADAAAVSGIAACTIAAGYAASLFIGSGLTPYDRLAGTTVRDRA